MNSVGISNENSKDMYIFLIIGGIGIIVLMARLAFSGTSDYSGIDEPVDWHERDKIKPGALSRKKIESGTIH